MRISPTLLCLALAAGCTTAPTNLNFGDGSSEWANDGDCDDPRFDGPWAHSVLAPADAGRDASDCRMLFEAGRVFLRADYQEGVTYENPDYVGPN